LTFLDKKRRRFLSAASKTWEKNFINTRFHAVADGDEIQKSFKSFLTLP